MGERTSEFYTLCRVEFAAGNKYSPLLTKPTPNELSDEIKKQIRSGVPADRLVVFKQIPFDVKVGIAFKEGIE